MLAQGVLLVGTFAAVEPVISRKSGQPVPVPGFFNLIVANTRGDGEHYTRRASFSSYERDSESRTTISRTIEALGLREGELIAVKCAVSARRDSEFVNYDAIDVARVRIEVEQPAHANGAAVRAPEPVDSF